MTDDQLTALNTLAGAVAIAELFLIFGLLAFRTALNIKRRESVPLLQARDLLLFTFFVVITIAAQFSRATGIRLSEYPWWVIGSDLLMVATGTVYLAVELFAIGRSGDTE